MAIKRWNASTSQWELVGTPGTASPSAIGAAGLVGGNTFSGNQIVSSNSYISVGDRSNIAISGATPLNGININNSSSRPRIGFFDSIGGDTAGSSLGTIEFFDYLKNGQAEKRSAIIEVIRDGSSSTQRGGAIVFNTVPNASNSITERMRITSEGNIGIGVSSPSYGIHHRVFGNAELATQYGTGTATYIGAYAAEGSLRVTGANPLTFYTNATEKMRIDGNGTGYITSPTWTLAPLSGALNTNIKIRNSHYSDGSPNQLILGVDGTMFNGVAYLDTSTAGVAAVTPLSFRISGTQRMIIDSNGNLNLGGSSSVDTLKYLDIQNTNSGNSAGTIIRMITNNSANTAVTTVDMVKYRNGTFVIANNDSSGIIVFGAGGGTERMRIAATGGVSIGSTNATSHKLYIEDAGTVDTVRTWNTNANFAAHVYQSLATRANSSAYYFYSAFSSGGGDAEFTVRGDGQVNTDLSFTGGGADYAEYFEWADGNINNEDRRGYSVSLINDKIKIAEEGDIVFGVVSGNPSVVGDDAPMKWTGKYLKDDFGSYIRDEDGYRVLNPEYDEDAEYISREDRPEWSTIGLMGKLRLRKGQAVATNWIKMKDISEQVEEWLVR